MLLVLGIVCLGYYAYASAETLLYQAYETRELDAILSSRANAASGARSRAIEPGDVVGRIEIPRLGVTAMIKAGTDARTLQLAVGHIPGTAFPGEAGNMGLAGHRDTFFRRLRDIRSDDEIRVTTAEGVYQYRVERTNVVEPGDVWVLDPTGYSALTLVTCYPFTYVGSAPQRFIVRARGEDSQGDVGVQGGSTRSQGDQGVLGGSTRSQGDQGVLGGSDTHRKAKEKKK